MIDVKQAAKIARDNLADLKGSVIDVTLEEVEMDPNETYWYVTLSYLPGGPFINREYRVFKIDAESGRFVSMKIRATK